MPCCVRLNDISTWYRPRNTGICASIGRHPRTGLTPCSRCNFCISSANRCRSLPYFFCSALICGCISCICRVVRICLTNGLYRIARSVNTRNITASAHVKKLDGPRNGIAANALYQSHMIPETG